MRIIHVTDCYLPLLGGIETQVSRLAAQQVAEGHDVEVITMTPASPGKHGLSTQDDDGVTVHRVAARIPGGYPIHPRAAHHVSRILAARSPDLVHLHMGVIAPSTQASIQPVIRAGYPAVLTIHSVWGGNVVTFKALDKLIGWSRWPVLLTAVSDTSAAPLREIVGDRVPVVVVRNGVDVDTWAVSHVDRQDRAEGSAVHAVAASRFAPRKRIMPMLEFLRVADLRLPRGALRVTLAGTGPQLDDARRFIADNGMEDWVSLPGRLNVDELKELYSLSDVYLAPGVQDAFSISVLEAQAAGLAILSRSQAGAAECLEERVSAMLAADDDGMADQLVRLITEDGLLDSILQHNRTVPPATTWPAIMPQMARVYERTIEYRGRYDAATRLERHS